MTKRILSVLICVLLLTFAFAGCASKAEGVDSGGDPAAESALTGKDINTEQIKIAFIPLSTAGITNSMYEMTLAETLSMYENVETNVFDGQYDVTVQNNNIQECITQGYDAIIIEVLDTEASNSAITDAEAAGIPVVTINCGASAIHTMHIQGADYEMGIQGATHLAEACGNKGNIIILDCPAASVGSSRMGTGAQDYVENTSGMTLVDHQYIDNWSTDNAMTTMSDLLTKHSDIAAVYCASDDIALGAIQAIEAAGRDSDGILVWGGSGYPSAFQAISDGRMFGTSWCDTYSEMSTAVYSALYFISSGVNSVSCGYTQTPTVNQAMIAVTKDNVNSIFDISRWNYESDYVG